VVSVEDTEVAEFRLAVGRVARRLRAIYSAGKDEGDISFTELGILLRLHREGPASPGQLAGAEKVTAQAVSITLRSLLERALVDRARDDIDKRRFTVRITPAGIDALQLREQAVLGRLTSVMEERLTGPQKRRLPALIEILDRIASEL